MSLKRILNEIKRIKFIRKIINPKEDLENFEFAIKEIQGDIEMLKQFEIEYAGDHLINPSEKNHLQIYTNHLFKEYSEDYCPGKGFDYFTKEQKTQYLFMRLEIEKLLNIKNTKYII